VAPGARSTSGGLDAAAEPVGGNAPPRARRAADRAARSPLSFKLYTATITVVAAGGALGFALADGWPVAPDSRFWVLAGLVLAGELLPIQMVGRYGCDRVTVSTGMAFAVLLAFGAVPAMTVYAITSLVSDRLDPTTWIKGLFNAAQYVLSLVVAAAVLAAAGAGPVASIPADLGPIALASVAFFVANHVLAGFGAALLTKQSPGAYLSQDFFLQLWTAGFQLALAPLIVVAVDQSMWLLMFAAVPLLAIYIGGRQAAINQYRAFHDMLTDLPNRWALHQALEDAVERTPAEGPAIVLMIIDLDDFKTVNDTLGHQCGDALLEQVAGRMDVAMRDADMLARLGGDEFAVLMDDVDGIDHALEIADRLIKVLDHPFHLEDLHIDVTASIGMAAFPGAAETASDLLRHADLALYKAKQSESRYWLYAPRRDEPVGRLALASDLREAIWEGELYVDYQPKVSLSFDGVHAAEALVRWRHPTLGVMQPEAFIPLAEQTGLIKALTTQVLAAAIEQAKSWERSGLPTQVSVNLSARNLLDRELPRLVADLLRRSELDPALLEIEITESRVLADMPRIRDVLYELRAVGVLIAVDDFGTGFSSLTQLRQLPVDEIKIDKSFVINMENSPSDEAIVRSTVALGKNLSLAVTAEGVETEEAWRQVNALGCDSAQGFLLGPPGPAEECSRRLREFARVPAAGLRSVPTLAPQQSGQPVEPEAV
jgi:diguanylate cyclase (GGDEF)-like protein